RGRRLLGSAQSLLRRLCLRFGLRRGWWSLAFRFLAFRLFFLSWWRRRSRRRTRCLRWRYLGRGAWLRRTPWLLILPADLSERGRWNNIRPRRRLRDIPARLLVLPAELGVSGRRHKNGPGRRLGYIPTRLLVLLGVLAVRHRGPECPYPCAQKC